jgi:hypothetical protein
MKTIRHYTVAANNRLNKCIGGVAAVWNDSNTIELTMTVKEIKDLEKRIGEDIDDVISDELMRKLLDSFHGEGMLTDEKGIRL